MGDSCPICIENYTTMKRKKIVCSYCDYTSCSSCTKQYILGTPETAHCLNCRKAWSRHFLVTQFSQSFVKKEYKQARETVLYDLEKAMFFDTQPHVEAEKKRQYAFKLIDTKNSEMADIHRQMRNMTVVTVDDKVRWGELAKVAACLDIDILVLDFSTRNQSEIVVDTSDRRKFIKHCPYPSCNGYLSTAWKCGLCEKYTCNLCHEPKLDNHVCNEDSVKSVALIKVDSKPCPKCGVSIHKTEGCFGIDTPIILWSGETKMSQDILIGDILIGDDGKPRTVLELFKGTDELYEVSQNNGMNYTVNSKHKLVVRFSGDRTIYKYGNGWKINWFDNGMRTKQFDSEKDAEEFKSSINTPYEIEMTVDEYIRLSDSCKKSLMGFKVSEICWDYKDLKIDPYLMGLWIGDGINNGMCFAANDIEVLEYLVEWCDKNNMELVHDGPYKFRTRRRQYSQGRLAIGKGTSCNTCIGCKQLETSICDLPNKPYETKKIFDSTNQLKTILESYNLIKNKHIPNDFILNSRETRLKLLAGLIDSDGHVSNDGTRVVIKQSNENIAKQIEFISQSLGFTVHMTMKERKNIKIFECEPKDYKNQYTINISGEKLNQIPTLIARKKCKSSNPNKNGLHTGITVKSAGRGSYYGWVLDGNMRFLLSDCTVLRNCDQMYCTHCHIAFSWRTGREEIGRIHNPHYYQYMREHGQAERELGDIQCGGLPNLRAINSKLQELCLKSRDKTDIYTFHMLMTEFEAIELPMIPETTAFDLNRDLRIKHLMGKLSIPAFKGYIQQQDKSINKKRELLMVGSTFIQIISDIMNRFMQLKTNKNIEDFTIELSNACNYINKLYLDIAIAYDCIVPIFKFPGGYRKMKRTEIKL